MSKALKQRKSAGLLILIHCTFLDTKVNNYEYAIIGYTCSIVSEMFEIPVHKNNKINNELRKYSWK